MWKVVLIFKYQYFKYQYSFKYQVIETKILFQQECVQIREIKVQFPV